MGGAAAKRRESRRRRGIWLRGTAAWSYPFFAILPRFPPAGVAPHCIQEVPMSQRFFSLCVSIACVAGWTYPVRAQLDLAAGASDVSAAGLATGTWQQISPPDGRYGHTAVFDPKGRRMIVFGGFDHTYLNDTWVFTLDDSLWHRLATVGSPPPPRAYHTAIY